MSAPRPHYISDYLEKTLREIQRIVTEEAYQVHAAGESGFLQSVDPRVKLLGMLTLLIAAAYTTKMASLAVIHVLLAVAAISSNISLKEYLCRTWLVAFLFAGFAVAPAIFSWVSPGTPVVILYQNSSGTGYLPGELSITVQGLKAAGMVLLRCTASLGLVMLLVKTTPFAVMTKAFQSLGVPGVVVMVIDLTYRYLFLFLLLLNDYLFGRRSRIVGREDNRSKLIWIGGALAGFFRLSGEYTKEIFLAMQARGYCGESHCRLPVRLKFVDALFILVIMLICIGVGGGIRIGNIHGL